MQQESNDNKTVLFFRREQVLGNEEFHIASRGGFANQHPGNRLTRKVAGEHLASYLETRKAERGSVAQQVYFNCFAGTRTFVIERDYFLRCHDEDMQEQVTRSRTSGRRKLSAERTASVLQANGGSVENIRVLPEKVFILAGKSLAIDTVEHILREEAGKRRRSETPVAGSSSDGTAIATGTGGKANTKDEGNSAHKLPPSSSTGIFPPPNQQHMEQHNFFPLYSTGSPLKNPHPPQPASSLWTAPAHHATSRLPAGGGSASASSMWWTTPAGQRTRKKEGNQLANTSNRAPQIPSTDATILSASQYSLVKEEPPAKTHEMQREATSASTNHQMLEEHSLATRRKVTTTPSISPSHSRGPAADSLQKQNISSSSISSSYDSLHLYSGWSSLERQQQQVLTFTPPHTNTPFYPPMPPQIENELLAPLDPLDSGFWSSIQEESDDENDDWARSFHEVDEKDTTDHRFLDSYFSSNSQA